MFLKFGFLPKNFTSSVIVPLIECKSGDLTDVNNHRAIAVSSALSKVSEHIIASHIYTVAESDCFYFGFKSGHSTSVCTSIFKRAAEHYTNRGSHVLFVSLTSVKHWTSLITGSFLINFWMTILILALLVFLHIGFRSTS
jgi:hypothetical protein